MIYVLSKCFLTEIVIVTRLSIIFFNWRCDA